jgi:diguanylate cyclase (GGDEF)-like protein
VGILQGRNLIKTSVILAVLLMAVLTASCLFLPRGFARTAVSDLVGALLMLIALVVFATQGMASKGRMRWFWMLQAAGWALWLGDQFVWITYDFFFRQQMPPMHPADALLFLAGAPMMAGFLLRPHREPSARSARLGVLDFFLLLLWWLYLYVSLVVSWQYISPNVDAYNRNFDRLASVENLVITAVIAVFWFQSSGKWKKFYAAFGFAFVFNGVWFYILNRALELNVYFTGSWYDIPYSASFAFFAGAALSGNALTPLPEAPDDSYNSWMGTLAMLGVLSLPVLAGSALLEPRLPEKLAHFRVIITLATMFLMALLLFIQYRRLNRELRHTNLVLQEASLTDPLTGLRNRRYFSASIEGDVGQALRSHTDQHNLHTSDLVFYLIDADNFKEVNDDYGHDVGDKVLIEMARRISSSIRHSDVLVRWGGEEFLIVSRYTDRKEAELLAQRVLSAVGDTPFGLGAAGGTIYRTCSMGWAAFPWYPDDPRAVSYEEVLTLADRGLHRAKEAGRNRAVGMMPAAGKLPPTPVAGLHSSTLQVDVLAVAGPAVPV